MKLYKFFIYLCLILLALSILIPVVWVLMASVKENSEFYSNAWNLPKGIYFQNFIDAWNKAEMGHYLFNSIYVTSVAIILLLVLSIPAAYALTRIEFRGRKIIQHLFRAGLFINLSYIVIPIFLLLTGWDSAIKTQFFINNRFVLAVIYASTALPFTIYLLSNYFRTVSKTYEEAAYIDGASYFRTMKDIMIPIAKPSIITVILFNFLLFWNEFILALTLLVDSDLRTLPVGLVKLSHSQRAAAQYGILYAGLVLVMIPTLVLYIIVQKKLTEGMMVGGNKE